MSIKGGQNNKQTPQQAVQINSMQISSEVTSQLRELQQAITADIDKKMCLLKQEVKNEIKVELRNEIKAETKAEVKREFDNRSKTETRNVSQSQLDSAINLLRGELDLIKTKSGPSNQLAISQQAQLATVVSKAVVKKETKEDKK